jgi:site-specific DNA-adenine methylase
MPRVQLLYPGGKGRLAPRIVSLLPRRGRTYLEPFAGRGNIFWEAVQQGLKFDRWRTGKPLKVEHWLHVLAHAVVQIAKF